MKTSIIAGNLICSVGIPLIMYALQRANGSPIGCLEPCELEVPCFFIL